MKGLWHKLEKYSEHHLSAFIFIMKMTPHQALRNDIAKVNSFLMHCVLELKKNTNSIFHLLDWSDSVQMPHGKEREGSVSRPQYHNPFDRRSGSILL